MNRMCREWWCRRECRAVMTIMISALVLTSTKDKIKVKGKRKGPSIITRNEENKIYRARTHSEKYQSPITPAAVVLSTPLATAHVHTHAPSTRTMPQSAHAFTCHSSLPPLAPPPVEYPTSKNLIPSATNGTLTSSMQMSNVGDSASKSGF